MIPKARFTMEKARAFLNTNFSHAAKSSADKFNINEPEYTKVPCIICGKFLQSATWRGDSQNQPSGGTAFISHGHYGSTAFDPMDGTSLLEINLCDPCLLDAQRDKKVLRGKQGRPKIPLITYEYWNGLG